MFRSGPAAHTEFAVLAGHLARAWREASFAIIDDGTLYGRQLAENVRLLLADAALEPVFVDTYRPLLESQAALVRRLQRSGASHVLIGGEARDAAIIAADAARIGYRLAIAGGSILVAPPADGRLPDGTITVAVPADIDPARIAIVTLFIGAGLTGVGQPRPFRRGGRRNRPRRWRPWERRGVRRGSRRGRPG